MCLSTLMTNLSNISGSGSYFILPLLCITLPLRRLKHYQLRLMRPLLSAVFLGGSPSELSTSITVLHLFLLSGPYSGNDLNLPFASSSFSVSIATYFHSGSTVATQQESPLFCRRRGRAAVTGPDVAVRPLPLLRSRDPPPRSDSPAGFPLDPQYRECKT
ncbi:hypothetical protein AAHA92_17756 [Salvia divinorum]|uniref:Uncharacterized protein n=1 Tax=Salvia divinorum TaxID=28513 RepID=A0ABD1GZT6_SALDI